MKKAMLFLIISSSGLFGMEALESKKGSQAQLTMKEEERPRTWSALGKGLDELLKAWDKKEQKEREEFRKKQQEREEKREKEFNEAVRAARRKREEWEKDQRKKHTHAKMKIVDSFALTEAVIKKGSLGEIGRLESLEEQEDVQPRLRRTSSAVFPRHKWAERIKQIQNESRLRSVIQSSEESSSCEEANESAKNSTPERKLTRTKSLLSLLK